MMRPKSHHDGGLAERSQAHESKVFTTKVRRFDTRQAAEAELEELALAHAIKGSAAAAYWRDDALERPRPMRETWGRFCVKARQGHPIWSRLDAPQWGRWCVHSAGA